jgi:hypothetical protein
MHHPAFCWHATLVVAVSIAATRSPCACLVVSPGGMSVLAHMSVVGAPSDTRGSMTHRHHASRKNAGVTESFLMRTMA